MWRSEFNEQLEVTGVILTKIDGDTLRGGAALSVRQITGNQSSSLVLVKNHGYRNLPSGPYVWSDPRYGDMLTLIEKASQEYDEKRSLELAEKMRENTFDFNDFIDQLDQVQNMGPMEDLLKMLPGMPNNPAMKNLKVDERDCSQTCNCIIHDPS